MVRRVLTRLAALTTRLETRGNDSEFRLPDRGRTAGAADKPNNKHIHI